MSERTDRLLALLVALVALLLITQVVSVPRNSLWSWVGVAVAASSIVYAFDQVDF